MAKKTEDFNWDDDFDFDFDEKTEGKFTSAKMKAGRRAIVEFGGSFLSGVKKSLLDPSNQRKILEQNAPPGFTAAFDAASQGSRATKEIYKETKDEFMKSLGDVDGDIKTITAKYGKHVPTRLVDRIEAMAEKTAKRTYASPEEEGEQELNSGLDAILADVAKAQRQSSLVNKKNQVEATGQIVASQVGTTSAILTTNKILSNISRNSDLLVGLTTAQSRLQRKHIELAYSQTVLQRQTLDVLQQTKEMQIKAYEILIKNTGLPEHIKATLWEETNRSFKAKLVGMATQRVSAKFGDVFSNAIGRVKTNMKEKAGGAGGGLAQLLGGISMYADMGDLMGSKSQRAGDAAGGIAGAILQHQLRKKLGNKYKNDPRMKMYGDNIQNLMSTAPGMFNQLQDQFGGFRQLTEFLGIGDLKANDSSLNVKVRGNGIRDLDAHQAYNRKSDMALTQVIPGWLGKMHHKLDIIASGNKNVEAETFDWERGTFATQSAIRDRTVNSMFNKHQMKDSRARANQLVNSLDSKKELQKKDRAILMRYVLDQANSDTGYIDPALLTNLVKSPILDIDAEAAKRIADVLSNTNNFNNAHQAARDQLPGGRGNSVFSNVNKNAAYQSRMANANSILKDLRTALPDGMRSTIDQAEVGNMEMLRDIGYVSWNKDAKEWRFDQKKYMDAIASGKPPSLPGFNQGGKGHGGPPGRMEPPTPYSPPSPNMQPGNSYRGGAPDLGVDGQTQFQRDLLEAIELHSSKTSVDVSNQLLEAIRQRLDIGVPSAGAADSEQDIKRKSSMFRKLMGATSRIGAGGKSLISRAMQAQLKIAALPFKMFTGSINAGASVGMRIFRGVTGSKTAKVISNTSAKFSKVMGDVYIQGRDSAALKMNDIKSGNYIDKASGKVITTLKDIKGAVVDKLGNVVISEDDFKQGIYTVINGKRFNILRGALSAGMGAVKSLLKLNTLPARLIGSAVSGVGKAIWGKLRGVADIYVDGERSPRLLGRVLAAGGYFNRQGKALKSIFDINGDVLDSEGNVVLSIADMAKGLVDKAGKPFRGLLDKIKSVVTMPWRAVKGIVGVAKSGIKAAIGLGKLNIRAIKTPFKVAGSIYSMVKGKGSDSLKVSAHTADTVDAIYYLLDARLAKPKGSWNDRDGSGFRDGSREDVLSRMKGKGDKVVTPEKTASNERRGMLGMLMALVGGIGTVIGTMRSWFGNIFGLMRMAAQTKMATSAFDAIGALAGGRRGRGRRGRGAAGAAGAGRMAGMLGKLKTFGKSGLGKGLGLTALAGGAMLFGNSAYAQSAVSGASSVLSGSDSKAFDANNLGIGGVGGGSDSGGGSESGGEKLSMMDRMMNGMGGAAIGEVGAIAAFPLLAALYGKVKGSRAGSRLPPIQPAGAGPRPTSRTGKMTEFLTKSTKGRVLLAALMGGGLVAGNHALTGGGGESLGAGAATSFGSTLGLELAMATLLPAALGRGKQWMDNRRAARAGAVMGPPRPPIPGGSLAGANFTPAQIQRGGMVGATPGMRNAMALQQQRAAIAGPPRPGVMGPPVPPGTIPPKPSLMGRAAGIGKGIFRNAGLFGTGLAAYDAYNTEGSAWDKTKAFGGSLLTTAAIGKGLSIGGKMFSAGGRAGLMQGARTVGGFVGRQALMGVGRAALMSLGGAAAGMVTAVGAPVLLTGLAIAAVGAGLYFGYKKFFGTDDAAIMRYRMAQYGISVSDEDKVTRIGQLEALCKKHLKITGKTGSFGNSLPFKDILKIFGVPEGDAEHTQRFATWFTQRFKPVFIKGVTAYKALTKSTDLEKADGLDKETKIKYLNDIGSLDATAYAILVMPFTSAKASKYDAKKVKKEYDRSVEKIGHEKGKGEKSLTDKMSDSFSKNWDKIKSMASDGWDVTKSAIATARDAIANGASNLAKGTVETVKAVGGWVGKTASKVGGAISGAVTGAVDGVSNFVASMTGSQKQWQMMVYKGFKAAGFSEQQARILTAEIGRENSYNPKYLFGGHADPHKGSNLGMLSWQGDRKPRLIAYLRAMKVIDAAGNITQNQAGLNAQAGFIMWELRNTHKKVGNEFLANPNISYKDGAYMIGKRYILWRIDDPKYRAGGIKNRDGFYNMLLKQLGATDGKGITNDGDAKSGGAGTGSGAPSGIKATANTIVAGASANVPGMSKAPVGNGVLLPQYQKTGTAGTPGVVGPVNAGITVGGVPPNHRAVKAATIATQRAKPNSTGYCAKYVADALLAAGYKFTRQNSAYMYASGPLSGAGFTNIGNSGKYQIGDVMVWSAHGVGSKGGAIHGHIQIFNGRNWVSDFIQNNLRPGPKYVSSKPTLWRDSTLIGKNVTGSVAAKGATPSNSAAKDTVVDSKSPDAKRPAVTPTNKQVAPAAGSGPVAHAPPVAKAAIARPNQGTTTPTDTALAVSNQNRAKASADATSAQEAIGREQLQVQKAMLETLGEIRDRLPGLTGNKGTSQTQAQRAMTEMGLTRPQPISMDINLK